MLGLRHGHLHDPGRNTCTRNCRFCAVATGKPGDAVDPEEPRQLAEAVAELGLSYAVLTSVDRDDLPDRGAGHFAACVRAIKDGVPGVRVEVLIPDYREGRAGPGPRFGAGRPSP